MTHHLGGPKLTAASPTRGPGKTPLGDVALPVGCHTETIVWTVLSHRLRRLYSVLQEIPYTLFALSLIQERDYRSTGPPLTFEGHISQSYGADIHSVHSFLTGTRRLIFSASTWGIHPSSCIGIDAFIASPAFDLG